ncbi:hypothetical protein [Candidatus Phytoplasma sacchari]
MSNLNNFKNKKFIWENKLFILLIFLFSLIFVYVIFYIKKKNDNLIQTKFAPPMNELTEKKSKIQFNSFGGNTLEVNYIDHDVLEREEFDISSKKIKKQVFKNGDYIVYDVQTGMIIENFVAGSQFFLRYNLLSDGGVFQLVDFLHNKSYNFDNQKTRLDFLAQISKSEQDKSEQERFNSIASNLRSKKPAIEITNKYKPIISEHNSDILKILEEMDKISSKQSSTFKTKE